MEYNVRVDAKGLSCPMPVIKAKKAIESIRAGEIMLLETTDRGSLKDFQGWVKRTKHELVKVEEGEEIIRFYVKKGV